MECRVQKLQRVCMQHIEQLFHIIPEMAPGHLVDLVEDPEGCDGAAQVPLLCQEVTAPVDLLILEVEFQWHLTLAQQELCLLNDLLRYILLIECYNILAMAATN